MKELVLKLFKEIANKETKSENEAGKDLVKQSIDISQRFNDKNNVNIIQYAQVNYGSILAIAVEMLEFLNKQDEKLIEGEVIETPKEIEQEEPLPEIEYKDEGVKKMTLDDLAEDICQIMYENRVTFTEFADIMKKYYLDHLMDRFGTYKEVANYIGVSSPVVQSLKKRLDRQPILKINEKE